MVKTKKLRTDEAAATMETEMAEPGGSSATFAYVFTENDKEGGKAVLRELIEKVFGSVSKNQKEAALQAVFVAKTLSGGYNWCSKRAKSTDDPEGECPPEFHGMKVSSDGAHSVDVLGLLHSAADLKTCDAETARSVAGARMALRAAGYCYIWLRRYNSFFARPPEMNDDADTSFVFDAPRFVKRRHVRFTGGKMMVNGAMKTVPANRNYVVPLPIDAISGVTKLELGVKGTPQELLACFCGGYNSASLLACVFQGTLVAIPVMAQSLPVVIIGCFGMATRAGEGGDVGFTVRTQQGLEKLPDTAKTNLCRAL